MSVKDHQARKAWRATRNTLLVLGLAIAALPFVAGTALAQHAEIAASIDCENVVGFTATAWDGRGEPGSQGWIDSRTNGEVRVWYTVDSADPSHSSATTVATGAFRPGNDFGFTGRFRAPDTGVIRVFAQAQVSWGNGADPGAVRSTGALARPSCPADGSGGPATAAAPGTGLEITKSASSATVDELDTITFTIVAENAGEGVAHDVGVNDNLWDRLTDVTGSYDGPGGDDGTCTLNPGNNHVKCEARELAPGESMTVTITATTPDLPLREGGSCRVAFDNDSWVVSNETGYQAPIFSNTVRVTVTGTGCDEPSPSPSPSPSQSPSPTDSPSPSPSPTVSPTTFTPTPTPTATATSTGPPTVHPTTVEPTDPGGIAFTGVSNTVGLAALALTLLTTGTGLLWIGRRRREDDPTDPS